MPKLSLVRSQEEMKKVEHKNSAISKNLCIVLNRMLEEISTQKAMGPANGKLEEWESSGKELDLD